MRFLVSIENTENEILLFSIFGSFEKIFSLKIFLKIQSNTFSSLFSISSENKNKKQLNQTPPKILTFSCALKAVENQVKIICK